MVKQEPPGRDTIHKARFSVGTVGVETTGQLQGNRGHGSRLVAFFKPATDRENLESYSRLRQRGNANSIRVAIRRNSHSDPLAGRQEEGDTRLSSPAGGTQNQSSG